MKKMAIVCLGAKGGSVDLASNLAKEIELKSLKSHFIISTRNELKFEILLPNIDLFEIQTISNIIQIPKFLYKIFFDLKKLKQYLISTGIQEVIFLQTHYIDYLILKLLKKMDIKSIVVIHDFKPHKGEKFPPHFLTKKIINLSNEVLALNNRDFHLISKIHPNTKLSKLPAYKSRLQEEEAFKLMHSKTIDIVFLGRLKKYKGFNIISAIEKYSLENNLNFLIAGYSRRDLAFNLKTTVINSWLSELEIERLICASRVLVLPYIEATQSGILEMAKSLKVPIVVTPVGGLKSQLEDGGLGKISRSTSEEDVISAISDILNGNVDNFSNNYQLPDLVKIITDRIERPNRN